jgi:hypothetical protein
MKAMADIVTVEQNGVAPKLVQRLLEQVSDCGLARLPRDP